MKFTFSATSLGLLLLTISCRPAEDKPWPWTPEVESFVEIYMEHGGQREIDWVAGDTTLPPERSLELFETIEGVEVDLVGSEPVIKQPIDLHFDEKGRLWVVQYLQYPFPAGSTITFYDQYLRAEYDRLPSPPPGHVRGADKITLLEDTNGDGRFDTHRDVITGLNMATSILYAYGGLWVMNPPYLLFYPEKGDGLPENRPEVRLEGFGLEDTHAVANALTLGPDGWIYGVQGSTSTGDVRGQSFLGQAVWRYHPESDRFELFSEGGGNPWTLDFDSRGRSFTGTNAGGTRGLHHVQGGRYVKNWPKHGPLTTPYSFGYFPHMDHEGYAARFSMTFVVYEEGRLPGYEGSLISGMALTNRVQASRFEPDGSTFRTIDTDALVTTSDRGFRPVDMKTGPDGAIYIADWCDIRMNHVHPVDTWDRSCGRIWRVRSDSYEPAAPFDLSLLDSDELLKLLEDDRKWYRSQARRLLGERGDRNLLPELYRRVGSQRGRAALESLWTLHRIEALDQRQAAEWLDHPDPDLRSWTIRLAGDSEELDTLFFERLLRLAGIEEEVTVRSQIASTSRRLPPEQALPIISRLAGFGEDLHDPHQPLLLWWALEEMAGRNMDAVLDFIEEHPSLWQKPLFVAELAWRLAKRLAWQRGENPFYSRIDPFENWIEYAYYPRLRMPDGKGDYTEWETDRSDAVEGTNLDRLSRLLELAPESISHASLMEGVLLGLSQGPPVGELPSSLSETIRRLYRSDKGSLTLLEAARLMGHPDVSRWASHRLSLAEEEGEFSHLREILSKERGAEVYRNHCASCHQTDGSGMAGMAAPLRDSPFLTGDREVLISILLHGVTGEMMMPAMGTLSDRELADVVNYLNDRWGSGDENVDPSEIGRVRNEQAGRNRPWNREELE